MLLMINSMINTTQCFFRHHVMRVVFLRAVTVRRVLSVIVISSVLWFEWLNLATIAWSLPHSFPPSTVSVLIVADPQLIGYRNEPRSYGAFARWDSDRYLARSFSQAMHFAKPSLVLFLGDLFDEGEEMNNQELEWTMQRFKNIYDLPASVQRVYIPGDNDVGGEGSAVRQSLEDRFAQHFPNSLNLSALGLAMISLIHVNLFNGRSEMLTPSSKMNVILSHAPLLRHRQASEKLIEQWRPKLILSAHDHTAEYHVRELNANVYSHTLSSDNVQLHIRSGTGGVVELQSPTCSYRMGVPEMGFGLLLIDPSGDGSLLINYQILWLPGRLKQLVFYLFLVCMVMFYVVKCALCSLLYPLKK